MDDGFYDSWGNETTVYQLCVPRFWAAGGYGRNTLIVGKAEGTVPPILHHATNYDNPPATPLIDKKRH